MRDFVERFRRAYNVSLGRRPDGLPQYWPTCAKCHKPVDRVDVYSDPRTRKVTVEVMCHGQLQSQMVPEMVFRSARLEGGVAFAETHGLLE